VVPLGKLTQLNPAFIVFKIVPLKPTAYPVLVSVKCIQYKYCVVPLFRVCL
jgi:hypothetical protein